MPHLFSLKTEVRTFFSEEDQLIIQEMNRVIDNQRTLISREILRLRDEGVRQALIGLGWTPPKDV